MLGGANVLEFQLEGGNKLMVRPSDTEPKIKAYLFVQAPTEAEADALLAALDATARALVRRDKPNCLKYISAERTAERISFLAGGNVAVFR